MEVLVIVVVGLLGIAAAAVIGPRVGVAAPLLLVLVGIGVSFVPFVPDIQVDPEWILAGVVPPLLYAAAVSMPAMEFRREFGAISALSIGLVVVSSVLIGLLFAWIIPDLGIPLGIALGAIVSPTDAVATSIIKRIGVSPRIVTVLEGESLLNDATALVALRSAIAATAAAVTFWDVLGDFLFAVGVALVIGYLVGKANLWVRSRIADATVNTVISFTVPFLASLPAEALGASGLVAAVVAGLVTGRGAIRSLAPQHRISDAQNWRAIELILEGAVFLILGLELSTLIDDLSNRRYGVDITISVLIAVVSLIAGLVIRAGYVAVTIRWSGRRARRAAALRPRLAEVERRLDEHQLDERADHAIAQTAGMPIIAAERPPGELRPGDGPEPRAARRRARVPDAERVGRFRRRIRRKAADIDYFLAVPLGWREGTVIVWAGMRGAITLAAAQTLPSDTPGRSVLVLTAFFVAAISLLVQGGTIGWLVRRVKPATVDPAASATERAELDRLLHDVADRIVERDRAEHGEPADPASEARREHMRTLRLQIIVAQRSALLDARDDGLYSSSALAAALDVLDADEISMTLRGAVRDEG
ncbi:cation:proton antiporter [Agromyces sp. MMS24-JH15]|uniref:cation:proton antiporter n=1 Tax=Agromyces sp. MMS24-JH15 TaxID=3243765 RepID=UPI003749F6EE